MLGIWVWMWKLSVSDTAHLVSLKGILVHVAWRGELSVYILSVFILLLKDIVSGDVSYVSVSGV